MRWSSDVQPYFDWIGDTPVPTKAETAALSGEISEGVEAFRRAMERLPGTARRIVERWDERKARSLVTGMMCHRARDDRQTDWTGHIDRVVARIRACLSEDESSASNRLTGLVREADILLELLEEIHLELKMVAADRSRGSAALRRRLGLSSRDGRKALVQATRAIERRDRARQQFARRNLRLVIARAKRMKGLGVRFEDLIQEGNLGLLRAIDKFEPERGFRFSTYAVWWIDQSLVRAVQNHSRTVRVPSHLYDRLRELRRVEEDLRFRTGATPSREVLANELGIELAELDELVSTGAPIRSVDEPVGEDGIASVLDRVADGSWERPEKALHREAVRDVLSSGLRSLPQRARKVLELRYGLKGTEPATLREIGSELGLSGERVRQIEAEALAALAQREDVCRVRGDEPEAEARVDADWR